LALFTTPTFPSSAWPPGYSAAIYLQFKEDLTGEWRYLGAIGEGKESAFFKVQVPESIANRFEILSASIGISILPTMNLPGPSSSLIVPRSLASSSSSVTATIASAKESLTVAKKLLDNFINYALSYSRTFTVDSGNESYIPAKIITDWYNNTVRKAQMDPIGFYNKLTHSEE
jgi:protein Hikeshi